MFFHLKFHCSKLGVRYDNIFPINSQVREKTEAQLLQELAILEAKSRQLREMEMMKKELEELLTATEQAKRDEELVREAQARSVLDQLYEDGVGPWRGG